MKHTTHTAQESELEKAIVRYENSLINLRYFKMIKMHAKIIRHAEEILAKAEQMRAQFSWREPIQQLRELQYAREYVECRYALEQSENEHPDTYRIALYEKRMQELDAEIEALRERLAS